MNEEGFRVFLGISGVIQYGIVIYRFIQLADGFLVMGAEIFIRRVLCLRMRRMILVIVSSMQAYMSVPSVEASMVMWSEQNRITWESCGRVAHQAIL